MIIETSTRLGAIQSHIVEQPLLESAPSLAALQPELAETAGGALYYGTGIATSTALSEALPFDMLGMMLSAEQLRQVGGFQAVYHHIADTHAKTNCGIDPTRVDERASEIMSTLGLIQGNLGLDNFSPILASSFDTSAHYTDILREAEAASAEHPYVQHQVADVEWYADVLDVRLKLGWVIGSREVELGNDERRPDRAYRSVFDRPMSFAYTRSGRTLDARRPKASPYISVAGEQRVLLDPNQSVRATIDRARDEHGPKIVTSTIKHLGDIVMLYEDMYGHLGDIEVADKTQAIIDTCLAS